MCSVGLEGYIVADDLLPSGLTRNCNIYCHQLTRLKQAIDEKQPELANKGDVNWLVSKAWMGCSVAIKRLSPFQAFEKCFSC